jgi:NAD(P)-dependent dehydrogenase (short-subunit alcohol dehydrogenase family)
LYTTARSEGPAAGPVVSMRITAGTSAYVSGAGSGIGRGIARRLAARGVAVGVCDISLEDARETVRLIEHAGGKALAVKADVSEAASVEAAAQTIETELGPVAIVCNNAGISMHGVPLHEIPAADWDWVIGVNIYGVIHGIRTFVPRLLERGVPAHIVNTASIGGFQVNPSFLTGAYSMTKYAVVALSEGLQNELAGTNIGVSVLAPAAVNTAIHLSERSRPERLGGAYVRPQNHFMGELIKDGASPDEIGARVIAAIETGEFYIFTHPDTARWLEERHQRIRDAFERNRAAAPPAAAAE